MSKIQHPGLPGSASEVSGNAIASFEPHFNATDESKTAGLVSRSKYQEDLSDMNFSQSQTAVDRSSLMLKYLFTSILEDVITQMWILEKCSNSLNVLKTISEIDYLTSLKYGVYDASDDKDELDGIDKSNINSMIYKIKKLEADRTTANKVMNATYLSLAEFFTFDPLVSYSTSIEKLDRYRTNLLEEESKNKILRKDLIKQVRHQRNHIKTVLYDTETIINKLRTRMAESFLYDEVRSRYIDNWQVARTEQHKLTIFNNENEPSTEIEYHKQRIDHELRVHTEVETLVTISITETLAKIEEWMEKFDKNMEAIDLKIHKKKNEYQDKCDINRRYEAMVTYSIYSVCSTAPDLHIDSGKLEKHDNQIKEWLHFKKEREIAELYHKKMQTSAIIVQAWWRGLLVRLNLGPYRVRKSKKAKKKP